MQTLKARCRWVPHERMVVDTLTKRHWKSVTMLRLIRDGQRSRAGGEKCTDRRSQHGCTVGVDRDPPVWCSTQEGWWNIRAPARAVLVGVLWCNVHGLWIMPSLRFCTVFSYTPPRHRHDFSSVDLERLFAPLVAQHSLTRLFADFTSPRPLYYWLDQSQDRQISAWTRFWLWLHVCSSLSLTAVTGTGALHLQRLATFRKHVSLVTHGSSDHPTVDRSPLCSSTQPVLPPRVWLPIVRTCFIHCTLSHSGNLRDSRVPRDSLRISSLYGLWAAWPIKFSNSIVLMRSVFHTKFSCPLNSSWTTCCNSLDFTRQWLCVWMDFTVCCVRLIQPVLCLNWCNTSPDWLHAVSSVLLPKFITDGLSRHVMYLNCPSRFTPMTFIDQLALMLPRAFHHHVLSDHCVRCILHLETCWHPFVRSTAVQPFFAAVDPVAVFIHHVVLHLSSLNCFNSLFRRCY